eukprot:PRCOL_00004818-RA
MASRVCGRGALAGARAASAVRVSRSRARAGAEGAEAGSAPERTKVTYTRPSIDTVERLTRGEASRRGAKRGGAGSRAVPHRLAKDEAARFAHAKREGFAVVQESGGRKVWGGRAQGDPLANSLRQLADARACACVSVVRSRAHAGDVVRVDLSPLRLADDTHVAEAARAVGERMGAALAPGCTLPLPPLDESAEAARVGEPVWAMPERSVELAASREDSRAIARALVLELADAGE